MAKSKIEGTDVTWSPVAGCSNDILAVETSGF